MRSIAICLLLLSFAASADDLTWFDGRSLPLEGRGWPEAPGYARLPDRVKTNVTAGVWQHSRKPAGECLRFATDANRIVVEWSLADSRLSHANMLAAAASGIDVYGSRSDGGWERIKTADEIRQNGNRLSIAWKPGRTALIYLPYFNEVTKFRVGVPVGAKISKASSHLRGGGKPVVFYGTSITHGCAASRPGMTFVSIAGRRADVECVNLGFAGCGRLECEIPDILAEIDAAVYVIDPLWNMNSLEPDEKRKRILHAVRTLHRLRPRVPIVLSERVSPCVPDSADSLLMRKAYDDLLLEDKSLSGMLHLMLAAKLMATDGDGTFDDAHPNDWGMMQMGLAYARLLKDILPIDVKVSLPDLFGDHAILQRSKATAIWGRGTPSEDVTVKIGGVSARAVAGADGWWFATLDTRRLGDGPFDLKVEGKRNEIVSKDVLIGEVWLAAGQSNMEFPMKGWYGPIIDFDRRQAECKGRPIRMFRSPKRSDSDPFKGEAPIAWDAKGTWRVISPDTLGAVTAVGYTFIDTLQKAIGGAAGVVDISWSGTRCWAWMPREVVESHPELKQEFERQGALIRAGEARKVNKPMIRCWNNQFYPISKMACRGMIWYQGCCDACLDDGTHTFPKWMSYMVGAMRKAMGKPDLPFLYCQLSGWNGQDNDPSLNRRLPMIREGQRRAQKIIPNSAMAVILDNSEHEIHNRMKGPAGDRLAALALNRVYGRTDVKCLSPDFRSAVFGADSATVKFNIEGSPLKAGPFRETMSWNARSNSVIRVVRHASPESQLEGFTICDGAGRWHWADAKIVGADTVKVWAKEAKNPKIVRYNWGMQGFGNLYNKAGLPASGFTTEE